MAKKNAKKKAANPGRKPGTPNAPAPISNQELTQCRACGSTEWKVIAKISTQEYAGEREGKKYTSIERRRCRCKSCGAMQILISRPFDPKKWKSGV